MKWIIPTRADYFEEWGRNYFDQQKADGGQDRNEILVG
jgi:hypothetical protein